MAKYNVNIWADGKVASFDLKGAGSVHLAQHTLLALIPILRKTTSKKLKGEIIRWDWVQDGDCVSQDPEVIFSV